MIEKIIEFSAKNKYIVIIFVAAAIVGAIYAIRNIPLDAIPDQIGRASCRERV